MRRRRRAHRSAHAARAAVHHRPARGTIRSQIRSCGAELELLQASRVTAAGRWIRIHQRTGRAVVDARACRPRTIRVGVAVTEEVARCRAGSARHSVAIVAGESRLRSALAEPRRTRTEAATLTADQAAHAVGAAVPGFAHHASLLPPALSAPMTVPAVHQPHAGSAAETLSAVEAGAPGSCPTQTHSRSVRRVAGVQRPTIGERVAVAGVRSRPPGHSVGLSSRHRAGSSPAFLPPVT